MFAKRLTSNAWLLTNNLGSHISIVWRREDNFISTHNTKKLYKSLEEIAAEFAEHLVEKNTEKEESISQVFDYPIKHQIAFEVTNDKFPKYKTKEGSAVVFAAGYWVLHYKGTYRIAISPKISTIDELSTGPYLDKFSANVELNKLNKRKVTEEIILELE